MSHPDPAGDAARPDWYDDGLRFECTQCGNCCTGPPGMVWFTPEEGRRMAEGLGLDESARAGLQVQIDDAEPWSSKWLPILGGVIVVSAGVALYTRRRRVAIRGRG